MSKNQFKKFCKEKVVQKALSFLVKKKESRNLEHYKGKQPKYSKLQIQGYLSFSGINISIEEKKWLFKCSIEDIELNKNHRWKKNKTLCTFCETLEITQQNLIECKNLSGRNQLVKNAPIYEDISQEDIEKQISISRIMKNNLSILKHLEDQVKELDSSVLL